MWIACKFNFSVFSLLHHIHTQVFKLSDEEGGRTAGLIGHECRARRMTTKNKWRYRPSPAGNQNKLLLLWHMKRIFNVSKIFRFRIYQFGSINKAPNFLTLTPNFQFVALLMAFFNPSLNDTSTVHYFGDGEYLSTHISLIFFESRLLDLTTLFYFKSKLCVSLFCATKLEIPQAAQT